MKKRLAQLLALALSVIMVFGLLTACNSGTPDNTTAPNNTEQSEQPQNSSDASGNDNQPVETPPEGIVSTKDTIVIANKGDVGTLAPYVETMGDRARLTNHIYETLILLEPDGTYSPVLATSWEWKDDTHIVFHLREGVKFHNGETFKADDVLFTLDYALKSPTSNIYASIDIENTKVIDDYTIEVALTKPDSIILPRFGAAPCLSILNRKACEADPDAMGTNPVGTGPYKYKDWVIGDTTTVERFDDYWGEKPYIKTIVYRKVSETTQRVIELETGGVDFAYDVPFTSVESLKGSGYTVQERPALLVENIYFNADPGKTLADVNLRKAMAYAIDYKSIVAGAANGAGDVPAAFASREAIGFNAISDGSAWIQQDIEKAKEYMAAAGYPDGGLTLNAYSNADNPRMAAAIEIMSNQFAQIGITLNVTQLSLGQLIGFILDTNNPWDFVLFGNSEMMVELQAARFDRAQCPFLTPHTDEMQAILDKMWAATDEAEMKKLTKELNNYVVDNMIIIPYYESAEFHASTSNMKGFNYNVNAVDFSKVWFD